MKQIMLFISCVVLVACNSQPAQKLASGSSATDYAAEFHGMSYGDLDQWIMDQPPARTFEESARIDAAIRVQREKSEQMMTVCDHAAHDGQTRVVTGVIIEDDSWPGSLRSRGADGRLQKVGVLKPCTRALFRGDTLGNEQTRKLLGHLTHYRQPVTLEMVMWADDIGLIKSIEPYWQAGPCPSEKIAEKDGPRVWPAGILVADMDGMLTVWSGGFGIQLGQLTRCTEVVGSRSLADVLMQGIYEEVGRDPANYRRGESITRIAF